MVGQFRTMLLKQNQRVLFLAGLIRAFTVLHSIFKLLEYMTLGLEQRSAAQGAVVFGWAACGKCCPKLLLQGQPQKVPPTRLSHLPNSIHNNPVTVELHPQPGFPQSSGTVTSSAPRTHSQSLAHDTVKALSSLCGLSSWQNHPASDTDW